MKIRISKHGLTLSDDPRLSAQSPGSGEMKYSYADILEANFDALSAIIDKLDKRADEIKQDHHLTALGKQSALLKAGRQAHADIIALVSKLKGVEPADALSSPAMPKMLQKDLELLKVPTGLPTLAQLAKRRNEDQAVTFLRLQEIRQQLKGKDTLIVRADLQRFASLGDVEPLVALLETHPMCRPVRPETLDELVKGYLETQMPEDARLVADVAQTFDMNVKAAVSAISKISGIDTSADELKAKAKGKAATAA